MFCAPKPDVNLRFLPASRHRLAAALQEGSRPWLSWGPARRPVAKSTRAEEQTCVLEELLRLYAIHQPRAQGTSLHAATAEFREVDESRVQAGDAPVAAWCRRYWLAAVGLLEAYGAPENLGTDGAPIEALDPVLCRAIAYDLRELLMTGKLPTSLRPLLTKGRPRRGQADLWCINTAVLYVNAASMRDAFGRALGDPSPAKSIQKVFGIKIAEWHRWRKLASKDATHPELFAPHSPLEVRVRILRGRLLAAKDHQHVKWLSAQTRRA